MTDSSELPDDALGLADGGLADGGLAGGGFEGDFAKVIQQANAQQPTRDIPPLHPQARKAIISDEEMAAVWKDKEADTQLFSHSKKKFRCECGIFNLNDDDERTAYQNMINNCLQKGWILARDDWTRTQEGGAVAAVKCLIPIGNEKKKKKTGNAAEPEKS